MRFQPVRLQPERVRTERPNAASVQDQVLALADACPDTRALLLDLECTEQLEITSSDMLGMLLDRLHERGIALYMVGCGSPERASTDRRTRAAWRGPPLAQHQPGGPFLPRGARSELGNEWALSSSGVTCPRRRAAGVAHSM
jgi:hypothetical protein